MNINEYKKYLQSINNTLDNASQNYQMRERLSESPVCDMKEYKPDEKKDKSSHAPTTAAGDSLRPHSKKSDAPKKLKEDEDIIEIPECVQQYFENYFGDNLTEDTDDEDIIKAVEDLVDLCEAVCDAVGLDESTAARKAETRKKGKYKYGTGPKPYSGSPEGAGASEEDKVYRARAEKGQGDMTGKGGRRVTQDTLRGGTLHNRKQGVTHKEYMTLKKRFGDQIK